MALACYFCGRNPEALRVLCAECGAHQDNAKLRKAKLAGIRMGLAAVQKELDGDGDWEDRESRIRAIDPASLMEKG